MRRGEVYEARLEPTEVSEQGGTLPVILVSRDVINAASPVVLAIPFTTSRRNRRIYPTQVLVKAPDGGLEQDSVALGEQVRVLAKTRLLGLRGSLSDTALRKLEQALVIALDLPGQNQT